MPSRSRHDSLALELERRVCCDMSISRRRCLLGSSLLGGILRPEKPPSWQYSRFSPGIAESALKRTVAVINELAVRHTCRGAPIAIVHALAEALFAHFDESC